MPSSLDAVRERCAKKMAEFGLEVDARYSERFEKEMVDLKNWQEHGNRDMAKNLLRRADENRAVDSNKSGSLLLYLLGISLIDPVATNLQVQHACLKQGDVPDIDTDFDPRYRDLVKDYIVQTFGVDNTCSIGTYGSYKTRAVILDIARALGLDVHEAMELTKSLELAVGVENEEGEEEDTSIDKVDWDELIEQFADLKLYFDKHPEVLVHARILRNQVKHMGTHAGGVIISDLNLKGRIPVFLDKSDKVVSCWCESGNLSELSSVGLVKFDILGLNNLCVVSDCVKLVGSTRGRKLERWEIPIDDRDSIRMGSKRDLVGIFQFENPSVRGVVDAVGMESLEDVSAITSLIRPGPRNMGMDMEFARRKHGEPWEDVKCLMELLDQTYGVMVYQEQVMLIARELAGFTMAEANMLRRGIGKKKKHIISDLRAKFMKGAQKKIDEGSVTLEEVETVWTKIYAFAGYGFNKAHGITYSALTCVELWLKYHYPVEYITALLNNTRLGKKKFGQELLPSYVNYARKRNFDVFGPDINRSQVQFTIEGEAIRYSIGHIKNVANSAATIVAGQPYQDMADFYGRAAVETVTKKGKPSKKRINKKVVESLIFAGAFDCFGKREDVVKQYYDCRKDKKSEVFQGTARQWRDKEDEAIGVCLSVKPLCRRFASQIKQNHWYTISDVEGHGRIRVFGRIAGILAKTSQKGNPMYIVTLTDDLDSMKFFVFGGAMTKFASDFKIGYVAAIPLRKFEDSETRFFDVDREGEIVER